MSPPGRRSGPPSPSESRPNATAATAVTADRVAEASDMFLGLVERAAVLVEQIGDLAERDEANYQRGLRDAAKLYRAMFDHGVDVGRQQEAEEMDQEWRALGRRLRGESHAELEARRYPHHTPEQLRKLRGRDRYPLRARRCPVCDSRTGGAA